MSIPSGVPGFVDVVHTLRDIPQSFLLEGETQRFLFCFAVPEPMRYAPLCSKKGRFTFKIAVAADNAPTATYEFPFIWEGDWSSFGAGEPDR